jgi:hypothetical protein
MKLAPGSQDENDEEQVEDGSEGDDGNVETEKKVKSVVRHL